MEKLNIFSAAAFTKLSPYLLDWFTKYAPKYKESRKLSFINESGDKYFYKSELQKFDAYLTQPWPCKEDSNRPNIPTGIEEEVKRESYYKCAICTHAHGELAHIDPVHNSKNNHPHNLIYICPNCHDAFDNKGQFTIRQIRSIKNDILNAKVLIWRAESKTLSTTLSLVNELENIKNKSNSSSFEIYEKVKSEIVTVVNKTLPNVSSGAERILIDKFGEIINSKGKEDELIYERSAYLSECGKVNCPLCNGSGIHNSFTCPVCAGEGLVLENDLADIDLSPYKQVACLLCNGSGVHNAWECPECRGVGTIDSAYEDEVDLSPYEQKECPLCCGSGVHNSWDCPVCRGCKTIDIGLEVNLEPFQQEKCPVCSGSGSHNGWDCNACRGVGTVDSAALDDIDLTLFEQVTCPLCNGRGSHGSQDCPVCRSMGTIDSAHAEEIDLSPYEQVDCPVCKDKTGRVDWNCRLCNGDGTIDSGLFENIDLTDFE
ncbi:HNH endonuclease signature motif containing protein [Vibrio parahaemolyticus]|uniref:HNH endonuclease signature motif containing protein n=1 Tax=Vibrio parahaemolyticus TaxID=670 RepID=UPI0015C1715C|nr:HNH endonuclease signature motif containing protein [Vibrio parahaemolyticus]